MKHIRNAIMAGLFALTMTALAWPPNPIENRYGVPEPGSYGLPIVKAAADGEVVNSQGETLRLRDLTRGRVTVMSFIYTRCAAAKACPMATGVLMQLHRLSAEDAALAKNMRLVSLSFDPDNDTPERMAAYAGLAAGQKSAAEWRFVTTSSPEKLKPILEAYGQAVDRKANPNDPTGPLNHTLRVFLVDRAGNIRNIYSSGTLDVQLLLADVKTLLLEPESPAVVSALTPAKAFGQSTESSLVTEPAAARIESVPVVSQRQVAINPAVLSP